MGTEVVGGGRGLVEGGFEGGLEVLGSRFTVETGSGFAEWLVEGLFGRCWPIDLRFLRFALVAWGDFWSGGRRGALILLYSSSV